MASNCESAKNTDGKGISANPYGASSTRLASASLLLGGWRRPGRLPSNWRWPARPAISVVNRSIERGQSLVDRLNEKTKTPAVLIPWEGDFRVTPDTDVLVNATSIGLNDESARVPINLDAALRTWSWPT